MKDFGNPRQTGTPPEVATLTPRPRYKREGIEVREEELGCVTAQRLFKMRCDCGRSWFELELPRLINCPACAKLKLVSI